MSEERKIRFRGTERGSYTIARLHDAVTSGELNHTAEFFSERKQKWLPVPGIMEDFFPSEERLLQLRDKGITKVKMLESGTQGECPLCKKIGNRAYLIDQVPVIPPEGCQCIPWCGLSVVSHV